MTATDELRKMLNELGVEWQAPMSFDGTARYDTTAGGYWFHEYDGKITIHGLTTEQAIAATVGSGRAEDVIRQLVARLGVAADFHFAQKYVDCIVEEYSGKLATLWRGTCHPVPIYGFDGEFTTYDYDECSECGAEWDGDIPNFCPWCGRKVATA